MSYCVNCGVELTESAAQCPLCDTPVVNPNKINDNKSDPPFPEKIILPKATKHKYSAIIISLLLLLPNIICIITNILFTPQLLWSIYVVSSSAMFWFLFIFPFMMKKRLPYLILAIDAVATAAYIFIFYYYNSAQTGWFWKLAVPLDVGIFAMIAVLTVYFSKKRSNTKSAIAVLSFLVAVNIFVCAVVNIYSYSIVTTFLTMIIGVSCFILLLFFIATEKNEKLRAWLARKFFF